jgi:hypothetical protein
VRGRGFTVVLGCSHLFERTFWLSEGLEEKQFDFFSFLSNSDTLIGFQIMIEMQLLAFQAGLKVGTQNPFNVNLNFKHKVTTNHVK